MPRSATRASALDHVVVVLFEIRSLDNVLGRLYGPGDGMAAPRRRPRRRRQLSGARVPVIGARSCRWCRRCRRGRRKLGPAPCGPVGRSVDSAAWRNNARCGRMCRLSKYYGAGVARSGCLRSRAASQAPGSATRPPHEATGKQPPGEPPARDAGDGCVRLVRRLARMAESARGRSSRRTHCAIRQSPSPCMLAFPCATCRTTPARTIPARPAGPITPLDSLDRNALPSLPTWPRQHREQLRRSIGGREFIGSGFA